MEYGIWNMEYGIWNMEYGILLLNFRHKKPHLSGSFILKSKLKMVGAVGFEPTTLWSQTRCATKLRHTPNWGE